MIYRLPPLNDPLDQGDIIDACPILELTEYDLDGKRPLASTYALHRILVLTQTCDLANSKTSVVVVGVILDAQSLVEQQMLKAADIRGPIRAGRVYGWYFLPKNTEFGLPEMIVDLRQLQTVRLDLLTALCQRGQRKARVQPLFREHLAKHFADTYSRIGLPEPYETEL
ncbi:MAG TPA: hypothetical protein VE999_11455 [Gemmataceae bacterium]|nr:hypothetical protein [Gemmataceae bacterium]